jgi:hypothetical protein
MTGSKGGSQIPLLAAQCALLLVGLSAVFFEWFVGSAVGEDVQWGVRDMPFTAALLGVGLLITGVAAVMVHRTASNRWKQTGALAAGGTAVWLATGSLVVENATSALSPSFVPKSLQRLTFNVTSGTGIWLMVAITAALAVSMYAPPELPRPSFALLKRYRTSVALCAVGVCALALMFGGRYETWVDLQLPDGPRQFTGWTLPYVGAGSFVVLVLAVVSCVAAATGLGELFLLPGAAAAWFGACCTAVMHLGLQSVEEFNVLRWLLDRLPEDVTRYTGTQASLQPGDGPLMYFAGTILVLILVTVAVLRLPRPELAAS